MKQDLRETLNRLAVKILVFDAAILVVMITLALLITKQSKQRLADQLSESFRAPLLAGDTRQILQDMVRPVYKDFLGFAWKTPGGAREFLVPANLKKPDWILSGSVKVPVFFDEERKVPAGILWFYYHNWAALPLALIAWFFLVGLSVAVMYFERKRMIREYQSALETESNRLKADIAAQVAHDIRSPLAALSATAKGLNIPEEQRTLVDGALGRMQSIANDLLARYRAPDAKIKSKIEACALAGLIDQVLTEKRLQHREKAGLKIEYNAGTDNIQAAVDAKEFQRIISNLVNNSIEAFGGPGTITVSLASTGSQFLLEIKDNGKGIPPELLARLGQKGETHGKAGGTGLGLYHARTTVENWGGTIKLASDTGKGTTIAITLPVATRPAAGPFAVLLDDDPLVHMNWKLAAKAAGVELRAYKIPEDFTAGLDALPKDIPIYIDSDLGNGIKGENIAIELHDKGFTSLTMATGRGQEEFSPLPWLNVTGKEPPWAT